jgi:hypothetical protein
MSTSHRLAFLAVIVTVLGTAAARSEVSLEPGIDRKGRDYTRFVSDSAEACRAACDRDRRCAAFTFVRPNTTQGPQGRCWLKSSAPPGIQHHCCVSGVKAGSESDAARNPRNYPEGCAVTNNSGQVEPRASLTVVNRSSHPVYVKGGQGLEELGSVAPNSSRTWRYFLRVGSNVIGYGAQRGTNRTITLRVTNQGPRTCSAVRTLTYAVR